MREVTRLGLVGALALVGGSGHAADWVSAGETQHVQLSVDTQTLQRTGNRVEIWSQVAYDSPQSPPGFRTPFRATRQLAIYDCVARTVTRLRQLTFVSLDSAEPASMDDLAGKPREIEPETIDELVLKYACKAPRPSP